MGAPTAAVTAVQAAQQQRQQQKQQRETDRATRQLGQQQAAERRQREQAGLRQPSGQPGSPQSPPAAPQRSPSPGRAGRAQRPLRGLPRPRGGKSLHLAGKGNSGILLAEYIAGALIVSSSIMTRGTTKGYLETMSEILLRLTALTAVFFVLFLASGSEKAGKAAAWFGLLVDLGILFTAVTQSQVKTLTEAIKGNPTGIDETTLTKATTVPEPTHESLPS